MSNKILVPLTLIIFLILSGMMSSCSSSKATAKQESAKSIPPKDSSITAPPQPAQIPLPYNRSELRAFRAECDVDASADAASVKGSSTICILRTDSLLLTMNGPFGILVGKVSASRDYMVYFDVLRSEIVEGNPQSEAMQNKLPIPLSYDDLIHLMRCEVPFQPNLYRLSKADEQNQSQLFSYSEDERFVDFVKVSTKDSTLMTYQRKSRTGEVLFNVNYKEFTLKNGVRYPLSIALQFPKRNALATFTVTDVTINPEGEKYWFSLPKGVKRTKLN